MEQNDFTLGKIIDALPIQTDGGINMYMPYDMHVKRTDSKTFCIQNLIACKRIYWPREWSYVSSQRSNVSVLCQLSGEQPRHIHNTLTQLK